MISGVIFSFILTVICLLFAKPILMLLQVDASIFTMTTEYMRIIFFSEWGSQIRIVILIGKSEDEIAMRRIAC